MASLLLCAGEAWTPTCPAAMIAGRSGAPWRRPRNIRGAGQAMVEQNVFYERLTWPQVREAARADVVIIIPFASIEQHGPHLPLDVDLRLAREVCVRAARRNPNCLVMTPMAFGFEPHHMAWPGTIDVDWDVLIRYGVCVVSSLARHGFRRILIINGHGSNRPILEMIVRLAQVRHPEILCAGQSWFALGSVAKAFQPLQESAFTSHACELETSAYLAIDPALVDMSQAVADYSFRRSPHFWADLTGRRPDPDSTVPLVAMEHFSTGSHTGVRGDPSKASAEKGEAALEAAADEVAAIVEELRARPIVPPPDHHEADVEALKRQAAAASGRQADRTP